MKNKEVIVKVFKKSVITLQQAAKASSDALEALERLPDSPSTQEIANVNRLLKEMIISSAVVGTTFANNLERLQVLLSEN